MIAVILNNHILQPESHIGRLQLVLTWTDLEIMFCNKQPDINNYYNVIYFTKFWYLPE